MRVTPIYAFQRATSLQLQEHMEVKENTTYIRKVFPFVSLTCLILIKEVLNEYM